MGDNIYIGVADAMTVRRQAANYHCAGDAVIKRIKSAPCNAREPQVVEHCVESST